ncbi:hypothetical protein [Arachnia propionica]|uniref:Uncharacterized protein n=1 Tax=Arachnia propionica TaxID=1750 RepID=A0A3P1WMR2_9ACTN|nr:hypothetical protein [Arachnia propionica]RRD47611.1 hypothetical protein EII35_14815 [Arachnia propionica]
MKPAGANDLSESRPEGNVAGRIDAVTMLRAARNDPEMAIPQRPAFMPGGVLHALSDGLIVDGGASRQVLSGRAATSLVPRLIDLLDGTRTVPEVAAQLAVPAVQVEAAIALMSACGLIVPSLDTPDDVAPDVAAALARHLDTTKRWTSAAEAYRAAAEQPAYVVNNGLLARLLAESLRASGDHAFLVDGPLQAEKSGYIILVGAGEDSLRQAARHVNGSNGVVRLCGLSGDRIWVAPTSSRQTVCMECLISVLDEVQLSVPIDDSSPILRLAAGLIALEIFHERLGIGRPLASNSLLVHDLGAGRSSQWMLPRTPGCEGCGIPGDRISPPWPFIYDQAAVFPPRNQVAMKGHQMHYQPSNVALQWAKRAFMHSDRHRFSADPDWKHPTDARSKLGAWLRYGFGLREIDDTTQVRRFSPTGGNLGSPEGVVIVRDVENVKGGAYCYLPFEDKCAYLGEWADSVLSRAIPDIDFEAILVVTAALGRVEKKYHSLALRICFLDAGAVVSQLRHAANAFGFHVKPLEKWDDQALAKQLGDDGSRPVAAILGVRGLNVVLKGQ